MSRFPIESPAGFEHSEPKYRLGQQVEWAAHPGERQTVTKVSREFCWNTGGAATDGGWSYTLRSAYASFRHVLWDFHGNYSESRIDELVAGGKLRLVIPAPQKEAASS